MPALVATSPLAISTGTRLIVTIIIRTTLKRLDTSAFRISRITILDLLIANCNKIMSRVS